MDNIDVLDKINNKNAIEIYKIFIANFEGKKFVKENDIQFMEALLRLQYEDNDIRMIISNYSPILPKFSDKAREYLNKNLTEASNRIKKEKPSTSGLSDSCFALLKILSEEADEDKARILAMLLLVLDREIREKLKIELEELENEERDRQANVFAEAVRIFIELEDEIDRKLVNKKGNKR